ncbi:MAG: FecR domain-containing protein [Colwellia sp.]|nr:FecR domain-containing protein [Colwellia sp.]
MNSNVQGFTNKTIINQEAAEWLLLLEDTTTLSNDQIAELNAWVSTSEIHRECLESMAKSWEEMNLLSAVMRPQEMQKPSWLSVILSNLLIPALALLHLLSANIKESKYTFLPVVATSLLLCVLIGGGIFITQPVNETQGLVFTTKMGETLNHTMSDGSTLWLNSNTKIQVNYSDAFRRIKLLEGEAHFEVTKDATRPFEVYAGDRLVRAIGTAFSVHKLKNSIEVLVTEGTVELAIVDNSLLVIPDDYDRIKITDTSALTQQEDTKDNAIVNPAKVMKILGKLTAGQRTVIPIDDDELSDVIEVDTSEVTRFLSWKEGKLVFAGESLEEVVKEVTRHTQIKIDVIDPQLKSMRIGGQFQIGETDTLFYVLESGFGISVKKLNDHHVQLRVKEN